MATQKWQSATPAPTNDPLIGTVLGDRYRLLRRLGQGGMGVVYEAQHVVIEKRVAVKVLGEGNSARPELVQRFMQEAKAASQIGHENIIDVTDFGQTPRGGVFIAMEFLAGVDLAQMLRRQGPLLWPRAKPILLQVCRALGAAHAKGIIHRDLKPENIFVSDRPSRKDFVKVLDFGIAKISKPELGGRPEPVTRAGVILGTPEYMSPEQASGAKPDHRVDIYGLGVITYEMLTGEVPFHADTFMGILSKHMFAEPQPPSLVRRDLPIPSEVDAVVMRALHKDRDKRFQSMADFAAAIETCAGPTRFSGPLLSLDTQISPRPRDMHVGDTLISRRPSLRWLASTAAVVLAASTGLFFWIRSGPRAAPRPEVAHRSEQPPPVVPPRKAAVSMVDLSLRTEPAEAEVWAGNQLVGRTPVSLKIPAGASSIKYTLRRRGYHDEAIDVVPDRTQDLVYELRRARRTSRTKESSTSLQPSSSQAKPSRANQVRDLKDPFD